MTVHDLIEKLQELVDSGDGDKDVYVSDLSESTVREFSGISVEDDRICIEGGS